MMGVVTLTEFLLARIAEDETLANEYSGLTAEWPPVWQLGLCYEDDVAMTLTISAQRALAECEAKRRIVEEHGVLVISGSWQYPEPRCQTCAKWSEEDYDGPPSVKLPCATLRLLALPYADHSDYREEWRP